MFRPHEITVISADIGHQTSGQSRFAINVARGLHRAGVEVNVVGAQILPYAENLLKSEGIRSFSIGKDTTRAWFQARLLTPSSSVGRELASLAVEQTHSDWYVVLSDSALPSVEQLKPAKTAYICNGDLSLMFLNERFYGYAGLVKSILSRKMASFIRKNAQHASRFDVLLANSEFTREFMSYLYRLPFDGVVYPPVDLDVFCPTSRTSDSRYVVALARNLTEEGVDLLEEVAETIPLRIVGGASIPGAANLGVVPDSTLVETLSGALVTLFPVVSEFFGYAVAESLACGTPVVCYDCCGPAELVSDGKTGYVARSRYQLHSRILDLFESGVSQEMRMNARMSAARFSIDESAKVLLDSLKRSVGTSPQ